MTHVRLRNSDGKTVIYDGAIVAGDSLISEDLAPILAPDLPAWQSGQSYAIDEVVSYSGQLWRVIQAHTSQIDWTPVVAVSLFTETWPSGVAPTWTQPQGAHDAYPLGFEVYHAPTDRIWVSDIEANVWEPNSVADTWTLREDQQPLEPVGTEWVSGEQGLQIGDQRTYQGVTYVIVGNVGINIWPPPTVPALWQPV